MLIERSTSGGGGVNRPSVHRLSVQLCRWGAPLVQLKHPSRAAGAPHAVGLTGPPPSAGRRHDVRPTSPSPPGPCLCDIYRPFILSTESGLHSAVAGSHRPWHLPVGFVVHRLPRGHGEAAVAAAVVYRDGGVVRHCMGTGRVVDGRRTRRTVYIRRSSLAVAVV